MNSIDRLADRMVAAKERIAEAQAEYDEALQEWLAVAPSRNEGSITTAGDAYKVTTTYGVNRTVDAATLSAIRSQVPVALFEQAVEYTPKLKMSGVRHLMNNEPETWVVLAQAITAKPAKPQVKVELIAAKAA